MQVKHESQARASYSNRLYYTNALRKHLFHSGYRAMLHVWKNVTIGVERDSYSRVPEQLGYDLRIYVFQEQYGRGGMPEVVEGDLG